MEVSKVINELVDPLGFKIKPKQLEAVTNIVRGLDTLCILPTSFGKSLIFQLLPAVFRRLNIFPAPIIIVVSPLLSLIEDQISSANSINLGLCATIKLDHKVNGDILKGKY
jgi:ATP-dependent DNA helicase RecQ